MTNPPVVPDTAAPVCKTCNDEGMVEEDTRLWAFPKAYPCPDCAPVVPDVAAYPSEKARTLAKSALSVHASAAQFKALLSYLGATEQERDEAKVESERLRNGWQRASRLYTDNLGKLAAAQSRIEAMQETIRKYEADTNLLVRIGGIVQLTKTFEPSAYDRMRTYWPALFAALDSLAENPQ